MCERPDVPLTPAVLTLKAEIPDAGWFPIHITLSCAVLHEGYVIPVQTRDILHSGEIYCSQVFDPMPSLFDALCQAMNCASEYSILKVEEEEPSTLIELWYLSDTIAQMHYRTLGRKRDVDLHLLVDRKNLYEQLNNVFKIFILNNGWVDYVTGYNDFTYNDLEKEVIGSLKIRR